MRNELRKSARSALRRGGFVNSGKNLQWDVRRCFALTCAAEACAVERGRKVEPRDDGGLALDLGLDRCHELRPRTVREPCSTAADGVCFGGPSAARRCLFAAGIRRGVGARLRRRGHTDLPGSLYISATYRTVDRAASFRFGHNFAIDRDKIRSSTLTWAPATRAIPQEWPASPEI